MNFKFLALDISIGILVLYHVNGLTGTYFSLIQTSTLKIQII